MRLNALHLTNVRKFTGQRASITGIGPGITVVSEANEFGKSTFFDALHALFFEKYSGSPKPVKSLQPYAGGAVEVAAEIETDEGAFRVEKRFLARKTARILRLSDGATIAQDDAAERWIATLLGGAGEGPAGLLWVRQGLLGLEPDAAKEKTLLTETRRDLLSSVAGEIDAMTGGRRMDRVMRRLAEDLEPLRTKTGRKTGDWKTAAERVETLEVELGRVSAQVETLNGALTQRRSDEALLARLDHPEAKHRRDRALAQATATLDSARAHAGQVSTARQNRDIAALQAKAARSDLDSFLASLALLSTAQAGAASKQTAAEAAEAEATHLRAHVETAKATEAQTRAALARAEATLNAARRQDAARQARATVAQLDSKIAQAETAQGQGDTARARMKASRATARWLARAEAAVAAVAQSEAAQAAQVTTLHIIYDGTACITLNGASVAGDQAITLDGTAQIDLPGIGRMTVRAPARAADAAQALAQAIAARDAVLAEAGADTIGAARHLAAERAAAERQSELADAVANTLAPEGLATLHAARAEAALTAGAADAAPLPAMADLQAAQETARGAQETANQRLRALADDHTQAREAAIKARVTAESAADARNKARASAGPDDTHAPRRAALLRSEAALAEALAQAEAALAQLSADAPDLATTEAEVQRAQEAVTAAARQRAQVAERLAATTAQIRTLAGGGIEEQRDDLRGQLDAARTTEARLARKVAALTRLHNALEAERAAAQDTYFGPVHAELKPLLSILHRDAALTFDAGSLLPSALTRGQDAEQIDDLSGGTREQIAILTRLAFARLFARQGRHMPIVLDDALVFSDDDRIVRMFTALTRVAQDQQILVFSCRQLAFQDLGGARPGVEISPA